MVMSAPIEVVPETDKFVTLVIAPPKTALPVIVKALVPPVRVLSKVTVVPALSMVVLAVLKVMGLPKFIAPVVMMLPPEIVIPADPEEAFVVRLAKLVIAPKVLLKIMVPVLVVVNVRP